MWRGTVFVFCLFLVKETYQQCKGSTIIQNLFTVIVKIVQHLQVKHVSMCICFM